jgi:hypothetical protein
MQSAVALALTDSKWDPSEFSARLDKQLAE